MPTKLRTRDMKLQINVVDKKPLTVDPVRSKQTIVQTEEF